jgi:hypothetical protein
MNAHFRSNRANLTHLSVVARIGVAAIALLIGACQAPAAPSASVPPIAVGSGGPSASPSGPNPSSAPSPSTPVSTPSPTPTPKWSKPVTVGGLAGCNAVVAAVDENGTTHLAATCGTEPSEIRYSVSTDGQAWTTTPLKPPADRYEADPQLAFSGDTLYLAYTRVAPGDGGCGGDGLDDVGVWFRTRTLPSGDWSEPNRLGLAADHLQSFRVSGSVIHATVTNEKDGETSVESLDGSTLLRHRIGDALGSTSLRIGDDGKGRVAYETSKGIGYGTVEGDKFVGKLIPNSGGGWNPVLTLAPGNDAYLLWTESYHDAGCAEPDPLPTFGTYFATNASGSWESSRLTTLLGSTSMTIDPATGEIHVLISDYRRMVHFHRPAAGGDWANETIARQTPSSGVIRQDPTTGALVVAYVADVNQEAGQLEVRVMVRQ